MRSQLDKQKHLSYSQVDLYETCSLKYKFDYVAGRKKEEFVSYYSIGSAFHAGLETLHNTGRIKDAIQYARKLLNEDIDKLSDTDRSSFSVLLWNLEVYAKSVYLTYKNSVIGIEKRFELNLPDVDIPIIGYIDCVLRAGFIDYKTVFGSGGSFNIWQVYIYSLWYLKEYGSLPRQVEIHWFSKSNRAIGINDKKAFGVDRININMENINRMKAHLIGVWKGIKNGVFYPNISSACNTCPYVKDCIEFCNE